MEIEKVDKDVNSIKLKGVKFELRDEANNVIKSDLTTDEKGQFSITDLRPGKYYLVETKAADHYELLAKPVEFTIVKSQPEPVKLLVENKLKSGVLEIQKVDRDDTSLKLEGVKFELRDEAKNIVRTDLTTDNNGRILITDLRPGKYYLIETKAAEHYELDSEPIEIIIERNQQEPKRVQVENKMIYGSVELTKVAARNHNRVLAGAIFNLLDDQGNVLYRDLTTDENGKIQIDELRPGVYQFVETKAPRGYRLKSAPYEFTIEKSQEETLKIRFENSPVPVWVPIPGLDDIDEDDPGSEDGNNTPGDNNGGSTPGDNSGGPTTPGNGGGVSAPGDSDGAPAPGDDAGAPAPGDSDGAPAPGDGAGAPAPGDSDGAPAPGDGGAAPAPGSGDGVAAPAPGDSDSAPAPGSGEGVAAPAPGEDGSGKHGQPGILPQTGETSLFYMLIAGLISLAAGAGLLVYRRFRQL